MEKIIKRNPSAKNDVEIEEKDLTREFALLVAILEKCRVPIRLVEGEKVTELLAEELCSLGLRDAVELEIPRIEERRVYRIIDPFERAFAVFEVLGMGTALIGPYLTREPSEKEFYSIGERMHLSPQVSKELSKYLFTLAVVSEGNPIHAVISAFLEAEWGVDGYTVTVVKEGANTEPKTPELNSGSDNLIKMRSLERRYGFENDLMNAVTRGRSDAVEMFRSSFSPDAFEQRIIDPLRNAQNYCIIMNTLLRKAAEEGGVHPLYLDEMSSQNAHKIEVLSSHLRTPELMYEIFQGYCRLVKRRAHKEYSPVVRRAVIMIDADLSADLTAGAIADVLDVSLGYLSAVFKKEVGKTVSEYVRCRRMEYAEGLLSSTDLQVQSIALAVGIVDLNYFTRLFKAHTGKTPSEYRRGKR